MAERIKRYRYKKHQAKLIVNKYFHKNKNTHRNISVRQLEERSQSPARNSILRQNFSSEAENVSFQLATPSANLSEVRENTINRLSSSYNIEDKIDESTPERAPEFIESSFADISYQRNDNFCRNLAQWVVKSKCPAVNVNDLLQILKPHFLSLPLNCKSLLGTPRRNKIVEMVEGQYLHIGVEICLSRLIKTRNKKCCQDIVLDIGIDGVGISNSSNASLWPILISIADEKRVEMVGVYCGTSKPSNVDIFLKPFVENLREILINGFECMGKMYNIKLNSLICDAPAKAFILNVISHSGYNSCTKCDIRGLYILNRVTFPYGQYSLRSNLSFENKVDKKYHLNLEKTAIEHLGIGCVTQVPIDYMHAVCLGVVKQLMSLWIEHRLKMYSLPNKEIKKISDEIIQICRQLPSDFSRIPRPLALFRRYKATEFRQLLLYTLPILLNGKLEAQYYRHFLKFHCAIKILCTKGQCFTNNKLAENLLNNFVKDFSNLYGAHTMSFNVHSLVHLSKDVRDLNGSLESFSAFKFENYMQKLKKLPRSGFNVLEQINNRLAEEDINIDFVNEKSLNINHKNETFVIVEGSKFSVNPPDNYCMIEGHIILKILKFEINGYVTHLTGQSVIALQDFFEYPINSRYINIFKSSSLVYGSILRVDISRVQHKIAVIHLNDTFYFLGLHQLKEVT